MHRHTYATMKKQMFYGAGPLTFERARDLRIHATEAEQKLWSYLKTKPLGIKFRRQHPLGPFIVDFYAHQIKLVIEADGAVHAEPGVAENDRLRQQGMESDGITVIGFTNDQIIGTLDFVKVKIEETITALQSLTSRKL